MIDCLRPPLTRIFMKILTIPSLGVLTFALAGCIGEHHKIDPEICDHHPGEYGCPEGSSSDSSTPDAISSSSAPVVVTSSSAPVVVTSSSAPVIVTSSSAPVIVTSSSAPVIVTSSSAPVVVTSSSAPVASSSAPAVSSSSAPIASSSAAAVNIEDLSFTEALNEDQSIEVDAVANLGEAFINLIDKDAFDAFYLNLVAQGLDEAAILKAVAALTPVGTAIGADFIFQLSGQYIIPQPENITLIATTEDVGFAGKIYKYSVHQTIDDVVVALDIELQFANQKPGASITTTDEATTYEVALSGLVLVVNELKLTTSDVTIELDTTNPLLAFKGGVRAIVDIAASDQSITSVVFQSQALDVNLQASVVNGIIGVDGNAGGTIEGLDVQIDMIADTATVGVTQPDVTVEMQGVDTSN